MIMINTNKILTHLFYFLPTSISFRNKETLLFIIQDELKHSFYEKNQIKDIYNKTSFNKFLKSMKNYITVVKGIQNYTLIKNNSFKLLAEKDINTYNSSYTKSLKILAKIICKSATWMSDDINVKEISLYDNIIKVADFYKNVDKQVSEWLYEFAETKK